mgnify:CR=1 FL=1
MEKQEFQIGDTIYCIDEDFRKFEDIVVSISLESNGSISYTANEGWDFFKEDIGKSVFKTGDERSDFLTGY